MRKRSLVNRILEQAELPGENLPMQPLVEICADRRVLIENHKGVTEYSRERIGVGVRFGRIIVTGNDLRLCQMSGCQLVISGNIQQVELCRG
jgi:sporulation protein YqfC